MKKRYPWTRIDPNLSPVEYDAATMAKIKSRCRILPNGCWEFLGTKNQQGYGFMNYHNEAWALHRLVLRIKEGPIPPGIKACHSCDFPPCANPDHIFAGTSGDNTRDSVAKKRHYGTYKTECKRGHPFTAENTYTDPDRIRHCKTCATARYRIRAGWPQDLAYSTPVGAVGQIPHGLVRGPPVIKGREPKMMCKRGHTIEGDNLYITPDGYRKCRACRSQAVYRFIDRLETTAELGEKP